MDRSGDWACRCGALGAVWFSSDGQQSGTLGSWTGFDALVCDLVGDGSEENWPACEVEEEKDGAAAALVVASSPEEEGDDGGGTGGE